MRAVFCWATLATVVGVTATSIFGQGYQPVGVEAPRLLADGSDTFGGSRKMLGSTAYTGTAASQARTDNLAPPFRAPTADANTAAVPVTQSETKSQTIYPSATAGTTESTAAPANSSDATTAAVDGTTASKGLRSLQQRLASVRKSSTTSSPANTMRPPVVEAPSIGSNQSNTPAISAVTAPVVAAPVTAVGAKRGS